MSRLNRPNLTRHQQRPRVVLTRPNSNTNRNDYPNKINIQDIATQVPSAQNIWIINNDVTIGSDQQFDNVEYNIIFTSYNFTNNGEFTNQGGTFYTSNNFINNGRINNDNGLFLNTGNLVFNRNDDTDNIVYNRGTGKIVNFGTFNGTGTIIGNSVVNVT